MATRTQLLLLLLIESNLRILIISPADDGSSHELTAISIIFVEEIAAFSFQILTHWSVNLWTHMDIIKLFERFDDVSLMLQRNLFPVRIFPSPSQSNEDYCTHVNRRGEQQCPISLLPKAGLFIKWQNSSPLMTSLFTVIFPNWTLREQSRSGRKCEAFPIATVFKATTMKSVATALPLFDYESSHNV